MSHSQTNSNGAEGEFIDQNADHNLVGTEDRAAGHSAPSGSFSGESCLLLQLPDEIILMIVKLLQDRNPGGPSWFDYYNINIKRWDRIEKVWADSGAKNGESISYTSEDAPFLDCDTCQSLAVVNRRLYQICQPLLWNVCPHFLSFVQYQKR